MTFFNVLEKRLTPNYFLNSHNVNWSFLMKKTIATNNNNRETERVIITKVH